MNEHQKRVKIELFNDHFENANNDDLNEEDDF